MSEDKDNENEFERDFSEEANDETTLNDETSDPTEDETVLNDTALDLPEERIIETNDELLEDVTKIADEEIDPIAEANESLIPIRSNLRSHVTNFSKH